MHGKHQGYLSQHSRLVQKSCFFQSCVMSAENGCLMIDTDMRASRYMSEQDMLSIAGNFSPYRCVYLCSAERLCSAALHN